MNIESNSNHKPMTGNTEDITKKSLKAAKYTVIFKVLSQAMSVLVTIFLVRVLSEHDYGIYNLFYSVIGLLGMVASFGIANTLQRYIPEYYSKGEFRIANNVYRITSIIRLLSNVAILGLALIFWENIAPYLKIADYKQYFMLFTLIILLHMQRGLLGICLNSFFLQKYSQGLSVIFVCIKGIGYTLAIYMEYDLWHILIIDLLAYAIVFVFLQVIYYRKIPNDKGLLDSLPRNERKRLIRYAAFYNFNDVGTGLLSTNFDNFIIVMYLNPVAVGAYSFCNRITKMIGSLTPYSYLMNVIKPAFFSIGSEYDTKQINQFYQILVKFNFLYNIAAFCLILLFSEELIRIFFGGKFLQFSNVLVVVYLFQVLNSILPVGLVAQLLEKADIIFYSKIFAVYNILADIFLIKYFGIWGAVIATGTAVLGKALFVGYFVRKEANFKGMGQFFLKIILFWFSVSAIIIALKQFIKDPIVLFIIGLIILAISFGLQFQCNIFNQYEKEKLVDISRKSKKMNFIIKTLRIKIS